MLYSASGTEVLTKNVGRVMGRRIHPWLFRFESYWYLSHINSLLAYDGDLADLYNGKGHGNFEIREFLEFLASEIEREYKFAARSRRIANYTGQWECVEEPNISVVCQAGGVLPEINGQGVVWKFKFDLSKISAEEALKHEFRTYYLPRTIRPWLGHKSPDLFAQASLLRLKENRDPAKIADMVSVLQAMSKDRRHPVTKAIERETTMDWTGDHIVWAWFQRLTWELGIGLKKP